MIQSEVRAEIVVQKDVRDALHVAMAGYGDGGNVAVAAVDGVYSDDAFRGPLAEKMRILFD